MSRRDTVSISHTTVYPNSRTLFEQGISVCIPAVPICIKGDVYYKRILSPSLILSSRPHSSPSALLTTTPLPHHNHLPPFAVILDLLVNVSWRLGPSSLAGSRRYLFDLRHLSSLVADVYYDSVQHRRPMQFSLAFSPLPVARDFPNADIERRQCLLTESAACFQEKIDEL